MWKAKAAMDIKEYYTLKCNSDGQKSPKNVMIKINVMVHF